MKFEVTLKQLREHDACIPGYNKVVSALKGIEFDEDRETYIRCKHNEPISLLSILETNGLDGVLWCLRCNDKEWARDSRMFAIWCARQVQNLMVDGRSIYALDVAEKFANGDSSQEELDAARAAALDAARAALDAAWAAAWAAWAAALDAAFDAAFDAWAALDAARDAQKEMFIKMCNGTAPWQEDR